MAARTAPNGVKERASFCLVFRSLNTTSSHRMFSMGYRRAKSTQGNTNFQKRIFWQTTSGSLTAGLNATGKTQALLVRLTKKKKLNCWVEDTEILLYLRYYQDSIKIVSDTIKIVSDSIKIVSWYYCIKILLFIVCILTVLVVSHLWNLWWYKT